MDWITEYVHLLGDPAHWAFELTVQAVVDGLILGVGWRLGMKWVRAHDKSHHAECGVEAWPYEPDNGTVTDDDMDPYSDLNAAEVDYIRQLANAMQERDSRKMAALDKMDPVRRAALEARWARQDQVDGLEMQWGLRNLGRGDDDE